MRVTFYGAAKRVTGSCYLVETAGGAKILVDCGMFQGKDDLGQENSRPLGFDPKDLTAVLLTHAHLDHCGRLPLLTKGGFRGPIISTPATRDLTSIVLMDAAHILGEHAEHQKRHREHLSAPIYSLVDVFDTMRCFQISANYGEKISVAPGVEAVFHDAGHILGSASILLTEESGNSKTRILFSGDLGSSGRSFLLPPAPPLDADVVLMETTYGDRNHRSYPESTEELKNVIHETFQRGGTVLVPTFALERTQEILFLFRKWDEEGFFPKDCNIYLDSPMAIRSTDVFERYKDSFATELRIMLEKEIDPFHFDRLTLSRSSDDSRRINTAPGRSIILAGSGMLSGGRMMYHLDHYIDDPRSTLIFVGYQSEGTLGRELVDGARTVGIFGQSRDVRINLAMINGFSAHADQRDLLAWCHRMKVPSLAILVHGETRSMEGFRKVLPTIGWNHVTLPDLGESITLPPHYQ
ncbi:MAG: MBL fold metallo-hydrolase [Nitrospirota bacterium]|nr:MBL fold metallo-hydrolase [Nitrospirota bacterium]